jgi:O-acetyl-ADP-ribose deacetylase (regulator of RNase III)
MIKIELQNGDIVRSDCEAVVNAANNYLWMGGGVAGALKKAGGKEIETEALKKGPITVGEAVVTGAGKLKAKYVIHAAVMGQSLQTDSGKIGLATYHSLRRAEELGIQSMAFPALGTGVGGFPLDECARIMFAEIKQYSQRPISLKKAVFVLLERSAYEVFQRELANFEDQA